LPDNSELSSDTRGEAAFRRLLDGHGSYLYGIAYAMTNSAADAEDLVQETFTAALNGRFRQESSIRTWLVGILVRRVAMLRRSPWWRRRRPVESLNEAADPKLALPMENADARLDLATMLAGLSPDHRAVIVLRELEAMTYEQIAAVLGVPRGTVESRLFRAREVLRNRYKNYL